MRQWYQGKEGFMKVTRIQDKYNPDKVWMIKRYLCGTFYVNQEIKLIDELKDAQNRTDSPTPATT